MCVFCKQGRLKTLKGTRRLSDPPTHRRRRRIHSSRHQPSGEKCSVTSIVKVNQERTPNEEPIACSLCFSGKGYGWSDTSHVMGKGFGASSTFENQRLSYLAPWRILAGPPQYIFLEKHWTGIVTRWTSWSSNMTPSSTARSSRFFVKVSNEKHRGLPLCQEEQKEQVGYSDTATVSNGDAACARSNDSQEATWL